MTKVNEHPLGTGLAGVLEITKPDGTVEKLVLNGKRISTGDQSHGNTQPSNSSTERNR